MNKMNLDNKVELLGGIIRDVDSNLAFTMLEIGALPVEEPTEPFHKLLDIFPGSQVLAFEVDKDTCEQLNRTSRPGITYYPVALGRTNEERTFYETNHPMCCSLYKPNEELISLYNNMEVAMLKSVGSIETRSIDNFTRDNNIEHVDFIKIDIQGAELDAFQGSVNTLEDTIAIVSEVEFIPHYTDQPLFGDVCAYLANHGFMFHKFLGLQGRALKPIIMGNNINHPSQHIWSDALYIRDITRISELSPGKLLKMGVITFLYGSPDVAYQCFRNYDEKNGTRIHRAFYELLNKTN